MNTKSSLFGCAAAIGLLWAGATAAAADAPVGLIVTVSGPVSPEAAPYTEVIADTAMDLGQSGKVSFIHYPSCRLVTVAGGKLSFTQHDVQIDGGAVEKETQQKCPKQLNMKISGVAGGVRLRSIPTASLAERPDCALVGERSRSFSSARVSKGDRIVASMAVKDAILTWPAEAPALEANQIYKLELFPRNPGEKMMAIDFSVDSDAPSGPTGCLLRVN